MLFPKVLFNMCNNKISAAMTEISCSPLFLIPQFSDNFNSR